MLFDLPNNVYAIISIDKHKIINLIEIIIIYTKSNDESVKNSGHLEYSANVYWVFVIRSFFSWFFILFVSKNSGTNIVMNIPENKPVIIHLIL